MRPAMRQNGLSVPSFLAVQEIISNPNDHYVFLKRDEGAILMITGYTKPLYLLPFDHRASYISGLFGWKEPLNVEFALHLQAFHPTFAKVLVRYNPQGDV